MPELPEAENIRRALARVLPGRSITAAEVFSPALRTSLLPLETAGLEGRSFTQIRRRGRYILADLDDNRTLLIHLGMSGVIRIEPADVPKRKHEHLFLHLDNKMIFRFECPRRFSLLEVWPLQGEWPEKLSSLGAEPLSDDFHAEGLFRAAGKRSVPVKNFLMDNSVVTGIGNIYAAEILYAAGISPLRKTNLLSFEDCRLIVEHSQRILNMAIQCGGSTISDFVNVDGSEGKFSRELKVYGLAGKVCPVCKSIFQTVRIGGRSSCFCPGCQK